MKCLCVALDEEASKTLSHVSLVGLRICTPLLPFLGVVFSLIPEGKASLGGTGWRTGRHGKEDT